MNKSKVLIIKTGGTIGQKPNEEGILVPSPDEFLQKIEGLYNLAEIAVINLGNIANEKKADFFLFNFSNVINSFNSQGSIFKYF